jgi:hypothetical protein
MISVEEVPAAFSNQVVKKLAAKCKIKLDDKGLDEFAQYLRDAVEIHLGEYHSDSWLFDTKGFHGRVESLHKAAKVRNLEKFKDAINGLRPFEQRQLRNRAVRLGLKLPTVEHLNKLKRPEAYFDQMIRITSMGIDDEGQTILFAPAPSQNEAKQEASRIFVSRLRVVWDRFSERPAPQQVNRIIDVPFLVFVKECLSLVGYVKVSSSVAISESNFYLNN